MVLRHSRVAASLLAPVLMLAAGASPSAAAGPKLRLISNGKPVPREQRTAVINLVSFPGFTCEGFNGAMIFEGSGGRTLKFLNGGGGAEAFEKCETSKGEKVSTATESGGSKLASVAVTGETITEHFTPAAIFEDKETNCVWKLTRLAGATPSSGPLTSVHVSGHVNLIAKLSGHSCPKTAEASGTVTIEAALEGVPPGSYEIERF
ncbi:MAG TPA: hypothetical protein VG010_10490 [Solirubrobacteraceae bacterium]|jgi:hypothetical protein|nr:hypothetical protein [Solirubrobacteraceae bacterium]